MHKIIIAFLVIGLTGPINLSAATSPNLGAAASYSVLSGAGATNGGAGVTTISGNFGVSPAASYTDGGITVFLTPGNPHLADLSAANAQFDQKAVFDGPLDAAAQPCTVTYAVTTELSTLGPLNPGVYCTDPLADFTLSGTLTLNGTGDPLTDVWIFRSSRDLIGSGTANVVFSGTGGLACNVWWRVANSASFTAGNAMIGNILAATSITFGQSATLEGRAFAYSGAVTLLGNTISEPTCTLPSATLSVVKTVINDNGGSKEVADFSLFIDGSAVVSGVASTTSPGVHVVSETIDPGYSSVIGGDCAADGTITLLPGDSKTCTITNNDIPAPLTTTNAARRAANIASMTAPATSTPEVVPEVLGAFITTITPTFVPTLPNTGKGGDASKNLVMLLSAMALMVTGLYITRSTLKA